MRTALSVIILFYQRFLSPWLPPHCRYSPSCSQYMLEAIKIHGAGRGFWLGIKRLLRCNPFGASGFDPVPDKPDSCKNIEPDSTAKETSNSVPR